MTVGGWTYGNHAPRVGFQTPLRYGSLSNGTVVDGDHTHEVRGLTWYSETVHVFGLPYYTKVNLAGLFDGKWLACAIDGAVVLSGRMTDSGGYLEIDGVPDAPWAVGDTVFCEVLTTHAAPPATTVAPDATVPPETPDEQARVDELRAEADEKLAESAELDSAAADLEAQATELTDAAADKRALAAQRIASAEKKEARAQKRPAQAALLLLQAANLRGRAVELSAQAAILETSVARLTLQAERLRSSADSFRAEAAELSASADALEAALPDGVLWRTTMTVGKWLYQGRVNRLGFQAGSVLDYGSLSSTAVAHGDETYRVSALSWFTFGSGALYVFGESPHTEDLADLWDDRWLLCAVDGDVVLSAQMGSMGDHLKIEGVADDGHYDAPWAEGDTVTCEVLASEPDTA